MAASQQQQQSGTGPDSRADFHPPPTTSTSSPSSSPSATASGSPFPHHSHSPTSSSSFFNSLSSTSPSFLSSASHPGVDSPALPCTDPARAGPRPSQDHTVLEPRRSLSIRPQHQIGRFFSSAKVVQHSPSRPASILVPQSKRLSSRVNWTLNLTFGAPVHESSEPIARERRASLVRHNTRDSTYSTVTVESSSPSSVTYTSPKPFRKSTDSSPQFAGADSSIVKALDCDDVHDQLSRFDSVVATIPESADDEEIAVADDASSNYDADPLDEPNDTMSLMRALTRRGKRSEVTPPAKLQISGPVNLLSTTNMLSYNAPDLPRPTLRHASNSSTSSASSRHSSSGSDSDNSSPTLTDASSIESSSPIEPNHLSVYFMTPKEDKTMSLPVITSPIEIAPPAIPKRAPSHSKREHERLARVRSVRSSTGSGHTTVAGQLSPASLTTTAEELENHPFGSEIAKLNEITEEFNNGAEFWDSAADVDAMASKGLQKFSAEDYSDMLRGMSMLARDSQVISIEENVSVWI